MAELQQLMLQHTLEQFVYAEVRMLDEQRWQEWEELYTEDGLYWAPASQDQPDPYEHVSLIFEDQLLRKVRYERFQHPNAISLQPFPRTSHLVSNVMVDVKESNAGQVKVNARFQMHEFRRGQPAVFAGSYDYDLVLVDNNYRIQQKKATLVNCEGELISSNVYF